MKSSSDSFLMVIKDKKVDFQNIHSLNSHVKKLFLQGYKNICLDMRNVKTIDHTFLDFLKISSSKININLFNTDSDIASFLFLTRFDKFVKIYNDEIDVTEQTKPLIKRRLSLVS